VGPKEGRRGTGDPEDAVHHVARDIRRMPGGSPALFGGRRATRGWEEARRVTHGTRRDELGKSAAKPRRRLIQTAADTNADRRRSAVIPADRNDVPPPRRGQTCRRGAREGLL